MVQLIAAIATDAEHMPSLLYSLRSALAPPPAVPEGETWGVGYFADGHALTIRRPGEMISSRNFYELASSVRSRVLIASIQRGSKGANGPPHRFRRWLFGGIGDFSALAQMRTRILDAVPDFVRSELADSGPVGLAFAMYLRELQQRNLLSDPLVEGPALAEALKRTSTAMTMLATEAGTEPPQTSFAVTNGRTLVVARGKSGPSVYWRRQEGLEALPDGPTTPGDPQQVADSLKRFRAIVFGADLRGGPAGWTEVELGTTLWVDRQLSVNEVHG